MFQMLKTKGSDDGNTPHSDLFTAMTPEMRRAKSWLFDRLARANKGDVFTEIGTLTPELAYLLLEANPENRTIKQRPLGNYIADIRAGRWELNGESIKISESGLLNDGQHRCLAVEAAGKGIKTFFTFGVTRESRETLDQGVARQLHDYLGMDHVKHSTRVAAVTNAIYEYLMHGTATRKAQPTKQQARELYHKFAEEISDAVDSNSRAGRIKGVPPATLDLARFVLRRKNREAADRFMGRLIDGDMVAASSPIGYARKRLLNDGLARPLQVEMIFNRWNLYRRSPGKKVTRMTLTGELPPLER